MTDATTEKINKQHKEIKEYLGKIDKLQKRKQRKSFIVSLLVIAIIIVFGVKGVMTYNAAKQTNHTPVGVEELSSDYTKKPLNRYSASKKAAPNSSMQKVTIDGNTSLMPKDDITNSLGSEVETEIYEMKVTNNSNYPFHIFTPKSIVFRRYSFRGEQPFSDADTETYKELAAKYFTYKKYALFGYEDKYDFLDTNIDDTNVTKDSVNTLTRR